MSLDRSLKSRNALTRHRNVLSRDERLALLTDENRWDEEQSVFGLPKVAHRKSAAGKKAKKEKEDAAAAAAAGTPAAAPEAKKAE
jgi:small basic protein (TIGR04137 family)